MIEVHGLTKYYGDRPAIQDVTFSVPGGQVLGFLGPNGAGKSTTMRILTGYISASAGSASIAGVDVFKNPVEVRRRIGYLPETTPLYNEMRVVDYLTLMCRLRAVPPRRRPDRLDYAIESCGLTARRRDIIGRLSKGLRQRVGLAQAVIHEPDLLILDEPTSGLDVAQRRETRELIRHVGRQHTVILSSHVLAEVSATCERVLIISQGRIVADDTTEGLIRHVSPERGSEIELLVRGRAQELAPRLRRIVGVDSVEITSQTDGECRLVVGSGTRDVREQLARSVVSAKMGLLELRQRTASLEDVFLELTAEEPEPPASGNEPGTSAAAEPS